MSQTNTRFPLCRQFLAIIVIAMAGRFVNAQSPQIGEVRILPVINVSLQVCSTGKESKRTTYSPPPGWYIRSHEVMCLLRYGTSSYAVSTVPAEWAWTSEEQLRDLHQRLTDVVARAEDVAVRLKVDSKRDDAAYDLLRSNSGKHALVLETNAIGGGWFRGGSGIQLRVFAEMVYIGDHATLTPSSLGGVPERTIRQVSGLPTKIVPVAGFR